jgi:hypothetical protein
VNIRSAAQVMRNTRPRTDWDDLPVGVRDAVAARTGPILRIHPISAGLNSGIVATLEARVETVFIKGMPSDHPRVGTQRREAEINQHVAPVAARLLWQIDHDGWNVLGFEHLNGRHADLSPGSADLAKLAAALTHLGRVDVPDLPLRRIEDRWAGLVEDPVLLAGEHLLHTDLNPHNILVDVDARIVDWAWPTLGAGWIDPACAVLWLIAEGHTPMAAEAWAARIPLWATASRAGITAFTTASRRLWEQISHDDPQPWKRQMYAAARVWAHYRADGTDSTVD